MLSRAESQFYAVEDIIVCTVLQLLILRPAHSECQFVYHFGNDSSCKVTYPFVRNENSNYIPVCLDFPSEIVQQKVMWNQLNHQYACCIS